CPAHRLEHVIPGNPRLPRENPKLRVKARQFLGLEGERKRSLKRQVRSTDDARDGRNPSQVLLEAPNGINRIRALRGEGISIEIEQEINFVARHASPLEPQTRLLKDRLQCVERLGSL